MCFEFFVFKCNFRNRLKHQFYAKAGVKQMLIGQGNDR